MCLSVYVLFVSLCILILISIYLSYYNYVFIMFEILYVYYIVEYVQFSILGCHTCSFLWINHEWMVSFTYQINFLGVKIGAAPRGGGFFICIYYFFLLLSAQRSVMSMMIIPIPHYDNFLGGKKGSWKEMCRSPSPAAFHGWRSSSEAFCSPWANTLAPPLGIKDTSQNAHGTY